MEHRPYKLLGAGEIAGFVAAARLQLTDWAQAWFREPAQSALRGWAAHDYPARQAAQHETEEWLLCSFGRGWIAVSLNERINALLADRLFLPGAERQAAGQPSPLAARSASRSIIDLAALFRECFQNADDAGAPVTKLEQPPADAWGAGSGGLVLEVTLEQERFPVLVGPELVISACRDRLVPQRALQDLADMRQAILSQKIELQVVGGAAEIEVGTLQTLAIGDVIRFDMRVDEPFLLADASGDRLADVHLGTLEDRKAVVLGHY